MIRNQPSPLIRPGAFPGSLGAQDVTREGTNAVCESCSEDKPSRRRMLRWGLAGTAATAAAALPGVAQATGTGDRFREGNAFYVAKSGDTLKSIAKTYLGAEGRWTEILALNADRLGQDKEPRRGQQMVLPASPSGDRTRNFAPLPTDAKPVPVPPEGYRLDKLGPSAYGVIVGAAQSGFVVTDSGVVVIDAPASSAAFLPAAIKRVTDKPVTHFIYSHSHSDHVGAANIFPGAVRIGHRETASTLTAAQDPARPVPSVTFADQYTLDTGGQRFLLTYPGPNHESGNILIQVPGQRLAVMIDIALPKSAPYRAFGTADSVPGILRAHNELVKLDFDTYMGGHMYRYGTKADVAESREFVFDMWNQTGAAITATPIAPFFGMVEAGNTWAALELWMDAITDKAEDVLAKKWIGRLGAVDVWLRENIKIMIVAQRVDQPKDL
jgi:glyoxylase-like metal-dependent hydrolase (beta-lactamase superfamily II)